jgi:hypothetical protein
MLYGIWCDLQERLARDGHRVRAYIPFGSAWYPYFMRWLAERPPTSGSSCAEPRVSHPWGVYLVGALGARGGRQLRVCTELITTPVCLLGGGLGHG